MDHGFVRGAAAMTGVAPGNIPAVQLAIDDAERAANALACEIDALGQRLYPVVRSPEPTSQLKSNPPGYPDVPAVHAIRRIEALLREKEAMIGDIIRRLEI